MRSSGIHYRMRLSTDIFPMKVMILLLMAILLWGRHCIERNRST